VYSTQCMSVLDLFVVHDTTSSLPDSIGDSYRSITMKAVELVGVPSSPRYQFGTGLHLMFGQRVMFSTHSFFGFSPLGVLQP